MKTVSKKASKPFEALTPVERGRRAATVMAKELTADHKRWKLPLLSWNDEKIVETKP